MNRIEKAFEKETALISFLTGGDPDINTTEKLIYALEEAGADLTEIGIPFSDPIAEGIVIQSADERALAAGCTTDKLFEMVKKVRKNTEIPLVFMTYLNPIIVYGKDKFLSNCKNSGIDGIIVPDMPFEEKEELSEECKINDIELISMIAPTSHERVSRIASEAAGFLYCVSSLGVTGTRTDIKTDAQEMITYAKKFTSIPCAVGFGISTPEQAKMVSEYADGVIIGSAIVKIIAEHGIDSIDPVKKYIREIVEAL